MELFRFRFRANKVLLAADFLSRFSSCGWNLASAPTFSTFSISHCSIGIDYLGAGVSAVGVCAFCTCVRICCARLLAQLRAEKADISGGSVIKRILFLASHCRRGWRERCIVGERVEGEKQGRGQECSRLPWDKDKTCKDKPLTPLVRKHLWVLLIKICFLEEDFVLHVDTPTFDVMHSLKW